MQLITMKQTIPFTRGAIMAALAAVCVAAPAIAVASDFAWAKRIASTVNPDDELAVGLALDSARNLYVAGWFDGVNDFGGVTLNNQSGGGQDIFVGKYNSAGVLQWARRAGGNTADRDAARGVGVDNVGNVYVAGGFFGTADFGNFNVTASQNEEFFLAKYDSAGTVQWVRQSSGGRSYGVYATGLAVDGAGNCYAVGFADNGATINFGTQSIVSSGGSYGAFLVKYDNAGAVQWAHIIQGTDYVYSTKAVLDSESNVCLEGTFKGTMTVGGASLVSAGGRDVFVAKFNSAGALQWAHQAGGTSDDMGDGGVTVDAANNVYICGGYMSDPMYLGGTSLANAGSMDAFIAKYNAAGVLQWARRSGGPGLDIFQSAATDPQGNIYVAAGTSASTSFGSSADWNVAVTKYDANGSVQWVQDAGGVNDEIAWNVVVDPAGNAYVDGWFQGAAAFGTNTLQSQGYWNFFLAKLASGVAGAAEAPTLTHQPASRTNFVGTPATFQVLAGGTAPLSYQWRRNGTRLTDGGATSGANTATLLLTNVQMANAATYSVVVSNAWGVVTSADAVLTVVAAPPTGSLFHTADTDHNWAISLLELTRVIELYNYRSGGQRTGEYHAVAGTEDGFGPGPGSHTGTPHSADADANWHISLLELTRVIELYNYRSNGQRTGQYRAVTGTEDGFTPGP